MVCHSIMMLILIIYNLTHFLLFGCTDISRAHVMVAIATSTLTPGGHHPGRGHQLAGGAGTPREPRGRVNQGTDLQHPHQETGVSSIQKGVSSEQGKG